MKHGNGLEALFRCFQTISRFGDAKTARNGLRNVSINCKTFWRFRNLQKMWETRFQRPRSLTCSKEDNGHREMRWRRSTARRDMECVATIKARDGVRRWAVMRVRDERRWQKRFDCKRGEIERDGEGKRLVDGERGERR